MTVDLLFFGYSFLDDKVDEVWEENWEDDNIEDDFSIQVACLFLVLFNYEFLATCRTRAEGAQARAVGRSQI